MTQPQLFCKAFVLGEMGCGCFESQRIYKHSTLYDHNRLHVATRLESLLASELNREEVGPVADFGSSFPKLVFRARGRCVIAQVCPHVSGHAFSICPSFKFARKKTLILFVLFLFESSIKCGFFFYPVATSQKYKPHAPTKIAARKQWLKKKLSESVLPWATAPLSRN